MKLTIELLKKLNACKEGIDFVEKNNLEGYDLSTLDEIKGDYNDFKSWLQDFKDLKVSKNKITFINSYGYSKEYKYDKNNNRIYMKDSSGFSRKYKYDKNNNLIFYKGSNGYSREYKYDKNNNLIFEKDSNGNSREYTIPIFKRSEEYFTVIEDDVEVMKIPLKNIIK